MRGSMAVMWRGTAQRLNFQPEDGLEVIATGKLTTYPGRSNYQIVVERMEWPAKARCSPCWRSNKARFEAEGLFDSARKRAFRSCRARSGWSLRPPAR
jgi:exodeoxyribonuclease VII large subunit